MHADVTAREEGMSNMAWNEATALERIKKQAGSAPTFDVQKFSDYLLRYEMNVALQKARKERSSPPLFSLPRGKAVVVDTVQIYVGITNYDEYRLEGGRETEASHERALRFLHLYYSAADRVIEASAAQRVDFHNGRVHAVVLERGNRGVTSDTLAEALAFVEDFLRVADIANRDLARGEFTARFRVGIDVGTCVAINNGTGHEQEPMFLGSAANHAAKLAAGKEPGIYLSGRARALIGLQELGIMGDLSPVAEGLVAAQAARRSTDGRLVYGVQDRRDYSDGLILNWREEIKRGEVPDFTVPVFRFHFREPPLRTLDYGELMPSNSIRMPVVSVFADLSGYTDYIDHAVATGRIRDAVRALYVIRQEFQAVVEKDFGGRKVRFIGDCIHAVVAEGSSGEIDPRRSVSTAALCAGGLHSSFNLCKGVLGGLDSLGLAVGLEIGPTPISRIGIRGDRSVRVASSIATTLSEKMQQDCHDHGLRLGPTALRVAPSALGDLLDAKGFGVHVSYSDMAACLSVLPASTASPNYARAHAPEIHYQYRAHLKIE